MILEKLNEPISMSFANETPLDDVLKYIKQATTTKTYGEIPIYMDPFGLQEAERSLNSTIQIDLDGVPLRRTLQLVLTQARAGLFRRGRHPGRHRGRLGEETITSFHGGSGLPLDQMLEK